MQKVDAVIDQNFPLKNNQVLSPPLRYFSITLERFIPINVKIYGKKWNKMCGEEPFFSRTGGLK